MEIGITGKPSSGKSSFFKAATMIDIPISARPFTTIKPNIGVSYVSSPCPCKGLNVICNPKNSLCIERTRFIPIKIWDLPGIIRGAHEGRGLGLEFLNKIVQTEILIHIVDTSGKTDSEGNPTESHDPIKDIQFLNEEIELWFEDVIKRNLEKIQDPKKAEGILAGIGIKQKHIEEAIKKVGLHPEKLAKELRKLSKPIVIAANKIDIPSSAANFNRLMETIKEPVIPCSAESEIALRAASKKGLINYVPGRSVFSIKGELKEEQKRALEIIKKNVLEKYGSTGVQYALNIAVLDVLKYIPVYPVENENKFSSKKGDVLPDAFLMPPGSTAKDLAFAVHTDIGQKFAGAIDARTKKRIGEDYILKKNDIIKILTR